MLRFALILLLTALTHSFPSNYTDDFDDDDYPNGNSTHITPVGEAFLFGIGILIIGSVIFFTAAAICICARRKGNYEILG